MSVWSRLDSSFELIFAPFLHCRVWSISSPSHESHQASSTLIMTSSIYARDIGLVISRINGTSVMNLFLRQLSVVVQPNTKVNILGLKLNGILLHVCNLHLARFKFVHIKHPFDESIIIFIRIQISIGELLTHRK